MIAATRHQAILDLIEKEGGVRTVELAQQLNVTDETIRRDLEKLEKEDRLRRTHGGAVAAQQLIKDRSFEERSIQNIEPKQRISKAASQLVRPGDRIFIDASSTALQLTTHPQALSGTTIITNSALVISELSSYPEIEIILSGGVLDRQSHSFIGPAAIATLRRYRIDKAFFSGNGIDEIRGVSEVNEAQAHIKDFVIPRCANAILLADPSKLGAASEYFFAQCEQINTLVTTSEAEHPLLHSLEEQGSQIIYAD